MQFDAVLCCADEPAGTRKLVSGEGNRRVRGTFPYCGLTEIAMAARRQASARKDWVFTLNNYTDEEVEILNGVLEDATKCRYGVYGREVGESGTPHLQGFVQFVNRKRPNQVSGLLGIQYVMHKRKVDDVAEEILKGSSKKKVEQMFTGAVLRPWQEALEEYLRGEVDSRSIIWCWEPSGNVGKSWFATYCAVKHDAIVFGNGKSADIKYAYRGQRIVIFDLSRTQMERVNYQVIEDIKNGRYFSSKYISEMRVYAPPHVVCFQIVNRSLEHYLPIAGFCSTLQRTAWKYSDFRPGN